MTCLEKFRSEHPGEAILHACPHTYGYLEKPKNCMEISCAKECWMREIPEDKKEED